jgi:hypothetical protein
MRRNIGITILLKETVWVKRSDPIFIRAVFAPLIMPYPTIPVKSMENAIGKRRSIRIMRIAMSSRPICSELIF